MYIKKPSARFAYRGLALLEVILGIAIVAIAIAVLINTGSNNTQDSSQSDVAPDISGLVNKSLAFTIEGFQQGVGYKIGDQETCQIDFNAMMLNCSGTAANFQRDINVSTEYLQGLQQQGLTSYSIELATQGDSK